MDQVAKLMYLENISAMRTSGLRNLREGYSVKGVTLGEKRVGALEMAVICAVSEFNIGSGASARIRNIPSGDGTSESTIRIVSQADEQRIRLSRSVPQATQNKSLRKRKSSKNNPESKKKKTEDILYKPGGF